MMFANWCPASLYTAQRGCQNEYTQHSSTRPVHKQQAVQ
jgi:hypothetical protein